LALRNPGMPLEALRRPITPIGMHYVLIHFDVPDVDPATFELAVDGRVRNPMALTLADLRARPAVTMPVVMECAGSGRARLAPRPISAPWHEEAVGCAEWTGTPLRGVLEEAGLLDDAVEVLFTGHDRGIDQGVEQDYQRSLPIEEAILDDVLLAYAMNGQPLPASHGFPLRLVVPDWYGMASVKWLRSITAIAEPFEGVQQAQLYRYRSSEDDPGTPVTRKRPRALMAPPGVPEFLTRTRHVPVGRTLIEGRAWSGADPVSRVEFSADGGRTWQDARLQERNGRHGWSAWSYEWHAGEPGDYELCVRATDAAGNVQPLDSSEAWNQGGYGVNAVQRVPVRVT
ncbi:MAG TPA: sulfite oxidase, partial [Solirubrobacteraceae bacterium]|nr:sulfite oxidase [Solirubrobacteraceae bacterium]